MNKGFNLYNCKSENTNIQINIATNCIKNTVFKLNLLAFNEYILSFIIKINPQIEKGTNA